MKKIGLLLFGFVVVMVILSSQNFRGVSTTMKRILIETTDKMENGMVKVYKTITSFITGFEGI